MARGTCGQTTAWAQREEPGDRDKNPFTHANKRAHVRRKTSVKEARTQSKRILGCGQTHSLTWPCKLADPMPVLLNQPSAAMHTSADADRSAADKVLRTDAEGVLMSGVRRGPLM